jgi:hypothetical protein
MGIKGLVINTSLMEQSTKPFWTPGATTDGILLSQERLSRVTNLEELTMLAILTMN